MYSLHKNFYVAPPDSPFRLPRSDPGRGGVLFFVYDCGQILRSAAGVEVTASPAGSAPLYAQDGLIPVPSATATFSVGAGTIINLPPGQVTLSATLQATGQLIGVTPILIEPGATTIVELVPTPLANPP
jgi:hypothetical protein